MSGSPRALGALGNFDRERVFAAAAALGPGMKVVHEDRGSILLLDREPMLWGGSDEFGLGWASDGPWRRRSARSWRDAAQGGLCGLAIDGRRRFVHSGISGRSPVYWRDTADATYFASRINALVEVSADRLSADWEAWAAILALRYPLGRRTPFAEIRRLGPYETLRRRLGRGRASGPAWPWGEVYPSLDAEPGADLVAEALRESLAHLESAVCPLSGGEDSRLLCAALPTPARSRSLALTVSDDEGGRYEEGPAELVAAQLEIPWEEVARGPYRDDWMRRAARVEYQFVDHAWLMPLADRVAGQALPLLDGYALDAMLRISGKFPTSDLRGRIVGPMMFDGMRHFGQAEQALAPALRSAVVDRARLQFLTEIDPYAEHPSAGVLCYYVTRTVRGISAMTGSTLGVVSNVFAPGGEDGVMRAMLAVDPVPKREARMHKLIISRLAPELVGIPSTNDVPRGDGPLLPRRWRSPEALAMMAELLGEGPLSAYVDPMLVGWVEGGGAEELPIHLRMGMESIALMHAWWRRYRDRLHPVSVADLLG